MSSILYVTNLYRFTVPIISKEKENLLPIKHFTIRTIETNRTAIANMEPRVMMHKNMDMLR